jgi:predicted TIM-barrel fold metal-dependent hydrolase
MDARRRVIDAHVHIWDLPTSVGTPFLYRSATLETLLAEMDAAGVERAVLVQPSVYSGDHAYLRAAVAAHPDRFAAVALLEPFAPRALFVLKELGEMLPLRGIRFRLKNQAAHEASDSPEVHALLAEIGRRARRDQPDCAPASRSPNRGRSSRLARSVEIGGR